MLDEYNDAFSYMCGGAVLPRLTAVTWTPQQKPSAAATHPDPVRAHPIVQRENFPTDITSQLVSWANP